jgi:hypothetical protein
MVKVETIAVGKAPLCASALAIDFTHNKGLHEVYVTT